MTDNTEESMEHWVKTHWRPMMGWTYMVTCVFDFIVFPILWSLLQAKLGITAIQPWDPITLKSSGLFHLAMGGVLGITSYGRTQEKLGTTTSIQ